MKERPVRVAALVALLAVATAAAYAGIVRCGFTNWDDPAYVTENPQVRGGLSLAGLVWAFTSINAANWHPLTMLSLQLDVSLFGIEAVPMHVEAVALHLAAGLALFAWLARATGAALPSWLVAALFLLHPAHVESVAWISERKDVLSALFAMLALMAWTSWAREGRRGAYWATLTLFGLGLLSKPMLVTFPCVLLLLDVWPYERALPTRARAAELVREKLPFFALAVACAAAAVFTQKRTGAVTPLDAFSLPTRVTNALVSYVRYLRVLAWPRGLVAYYPHTRKPEWLLAAGALALLVAVTAWAVRTRRAAPERLVGWLFYLGTLVPVIGLVQVGGQSMADRYTYLPSIGIFWIVAWQLERWSRRGPALRGAAVVATVGALVACAVVTVAQVRVWRNAVSLWTHAMRHAPNLVSEAHYASALHDAGKYEAARDASLHLVQYRDDASAWAVLASALDKLGDKGRAELAYARAVELFDDREATRKGRVATEVNYAVLLDASGRAQLAEPHFALAQRIAPDDVLVLTNYAIALDRRGRTADALALAERAVGADPTDPRAAASVGNLLARAGRSDEALAWLDRAAKLGSEDPRMWSNRGALLAERGRVDEGVASWLRALELPACPPDARANLRALVAALRERGDAQAADAIEARVRAARLTDGRP